jgi:hypothetical protein
MALSVPFAPLCLLFPVRGLVAYSGAAPGSEQQEWKGQRLYCAYKQNGYSVSIKSQAGKRHKEQKALYQKDSGTLEVWPRSGSNT